MPVCMLISERFDIQTLYILIDSGRFVYTLVVLLFGWVAIRYRPLASLTVVSQLKSVRFLKSH